MYACTKCWCFPLELIGRLCQSDKWCQFSFYCRVTAECPTYMLDHFTRASGAIPHETVSCKIKFKFLPHSMFILRKSYFESYFYLNPILLILRDYIFRPKCLAIKYKRFLDYLVAYISYGSINKIWIMACCNFIFFKSPWIVKNKASFCLSMTSSISTMKLSMWINIHTC